MIDVELLSRELVRSLRGGRSQTALNRRLRFASNVVYLWESGRRYPTLSALFMLAGRVGVDVPAALGRFQPLAWSEVGDLATIDGAAGFLRRVQGRRTAAEIAVRMSLSRQTLARWLRGATEPSLPEALTVVQICTGRLLDFVAILADPGTLAATAAEWERLQYARLLLRERPWSSAVLLALELDAYRRLPAHQPGWIARLLGIPDEEEHTCLELLERSGQAVREEERYRPTGAVFMNVQSPESNLDLRRWWFRESTGRLRAAPGNPGAWYLFTVSAEDYKRIRQLQRDYFREVTSIARATTSHEQMVLATMQLQVMVDAEPDAE